MPRNGAVNPLEVKSGSSYTRTGHEPESSPAPIISSAVTRIPNSSKPCHEALVKIPRSHSCAILSLLFNSQIVILPNRLILHLIPHLIPHLTPHLTPHLIP